MSKEFYSSIEDKIKGLGFTVVSKDFDRPWGAFLIVDENQAQDFADQFFDGIEINTLKLEGKLSPKILMVNPGARLSWQYHHRRAEIWQVYKGEVGIIRSDDDIEGELVRFGEGEQVLLAQGERHRLVGLDDFGIVAEIWQHTESIPSDEKDIVRVQDDFKRT
ncbi:phosphoheptose isomerase [Flavobacteriaceae bacterium]|nr:phosphoheptose isomerase [Flavobacteriaceae bacterium]